MTGAVPVSSCSSEVAALSMDSYCWGLNMNSSAGANAACSGNNALLAGGADKTGRSVTVFGENTAAIQGVWEG